MYETPLTALVLSGGGARAAYQVGVLRAIVRLRRIRLRPRSRQRNPFGIIVGTSAGAINAASLASYADRFEAAVEVLARVWQDFSADQVYRSDSFGVIRTGAQWLTMLSLGWALARWRRARPNSLLDNAPLGELLRNMVPLQRLPMLLAQHQLHALAVTASHYGTGEHVTFYDAAAPIEPWMRSERIAVRSPISHQHLLASSAIPYIFPAACVEHGGRRAWYGDGSMRQTAPLSPAIHLGAERLLIIGAGREQEAIHPPALELGHPNPAQIAGHVMASIFLDALTVDIERMQRINRILALLPDRMRQDTPLRPVESLVISPSQSLDDIAARHLGSMPKPVRAMLLGIGVSDSGDGASGAGLASYLLFEAPFTRELMALGEADTMARSDEVYQFFAWHPERRESLSDEQATRPAELGDGLMFEQPDIVLP